MIITTALLLSTLCFGQDLKTGTWLPQRYVEASLQDPFQNIRNLIEPIHCIVVDDNTVQILTFSSEMERAVLSRAGNRFEITNLKYMLNLKYYKGSDFLTSAYFLSQRGDKLVLDIETNGSKQTIFFINGVDGFPFKSWRDFSLFKSIRGLYTLHGSNDTISIDLEGQIYGSEIFKSLKLKFTAKESSYLMYLGQTDGKEKIIVIRYNEKELSFHQFKQKREKDWWDIDVLEPPFMIFDRVIK